MSHIAVVTGSAGFIGTLLCRSLREQGWEVRGLDMAKACPNCSRYQPADITQPGDWFHSFEAATTVFHLAGKVHAISEVKQDDAEYFRINTDGTERVLEAAQRGGVRRFVLFSTVKAMSRDGAVAGEEGDVKGQRSEMLPLTEEDVIDPDTPYGRSKLEAEKLSLHGGFVPEPVVLRLCMVYGAGAKGNIQKMLAAVDRRRFPPLPETGNRRSMVHVADVVRATILAAEHQAASGQRFIVSDGQTYSTRQIFNWMCEALGRQPPSWSCPLSVLRALGLVGDFIGRMRGRRFIFDSDALAKLTGSAWFSSEKIMKELGFEPQWDLRMAMPEMVEELRRQKSETTDQMSEDKGQTEVRD